MYSKVWIGIVNGIVTNSIYRTAPPATTQRADSAPAIVLFRPWPKTRPLVNHCQIVVIMCKVRRPVTVTVGWGRDKARCNTTTDTTVLHLRQYGTLLAADTSAGRALVRRMGGEYTQVVPHGRGEGSGSPTGPSWTDWQVLP
jgi:hypothetical protein